MAAHIERFAPSPTGPLHLGHAFSALTAWESAQKYNGAFLLRIEDNDQTRSRPEYEKGIYDDLHWLGLTWPKPVLRQSGNLVAYKNALKILSDLELTYVCECTRSDIKSVSTNPDYGPDGIVYPGTCRAKKLLPTAGTAIRLNMKKSIAHLGGAIAVNQLSFIDKIEPHHLNVDTLLNLCGDVVLSRRDAAIAYHLAVVVDDSAQKITHVTRGMDLFEATQIHRILQALLNLPTPSYNHHHLILDDDGKRLAKRDDSRAIAKYREEGATPADIRALVGL